MSDYKLRRKERSVDDRVFGPVYVHPALRPLSPADQAKERARLAESGEVEASIEMGKKALAACQEANRYGRSGLRKDLRFRV